MKIAQKTIGLLIAATLGLTVTSTVFAREASEGPRGGDSARDLKERKGGRVIEGTSFELLAREASEAPRGADGNNNRRNRGGRAIEGTSFELLAREASEAPRGADGNNNRRNRGGRAA
jgi:hypothetical protein